MKVKAAVLREVNQPYSIEDLEPGMEDLAYEFSATHIDIPRIVHTAMTQDLKLDKLVTNKFKLEDLNEEVGKMQHRQIRGRWVCAFD
jgi:Zn-dependent alcohol dehydrogenase